MKIPSPDNNPTSSLGQSPATVGSGMSSASKQPVGEQPISSTTSDAVQLSSMGRYLAAAITGSPAHLQKLSDLQAAIETGQFQVDAYRVSGSIIQHSLASAGGSY